MTMEQLGLTPEQGERLLTLAAKKLGVTPEQLAEQITRGKYDALLSTPQAQKVIQGMAKGQNRGRG